MNKTLVLKSGWRSADGGPVSAKAERIVCCWGLSSEWAGLRHHTPSHSPVGTAREKLSTCLDPILVFPFWARHILQKRTFLNTVLHR